MYVTGDIVKHKDCLTCHASMLSTGLSAHLQYKAIHTAKPVLESIARGRDVNSHDR